MTKENNKDKATKSTKQLWINGIICAAVSLALMQIAYMIVGISKFWAIVSMPIMLIAILSGILFISQMVKIFIINIKKIRENSQ